MNLLSLLSLILFVTRAECFSTSRQLLNIFENEDCVARFAKERFEKTLENGNGDSYCFKNKVSCIDYSLRVPAADAAGTKPNLLVLIAETKFVNETGVREYLPGSVCVDNVCEKKIDVSDRRDYSVVVLNFDHTNPDFTASGDSVTYTLRLKACPTTHQRLAMVLIIVFVCFLIFGCVSCFVIYRRRQRTNQVDPTTGLQRLDTQTEPHHPPPMKTVELPPVQQHASGVLDSYGEAINPWSPVYSTPGSGQPTRF